MTRKGNNFGVLTQKLGDHYPCTGYYSQQLDPVAHVLESLQPLPCLRITAATALFVKATEKIVECSLIIFVPHAEVNLNSQHTQHFSASCLISREVPFLSVLHVTLLHDNNFNLATLLPSAINNVLHDCLMLIDNLLTPCNDRSHKLCSMANKKIKNLKNKRIISEGGLGKQRGLGGQPGVGWILN